MTRRFEQLETIADARDADQADWLRVVLALVDPFQRDTDEIACAIHRVNQVRRWVTWTELGATR